MKALLLVAVLFAASAAALDPSITCSSSSAVGACYCGFAPASGGTCNLQAAVLATETQGRVVFVNPRADTTLTPTVNMTENGALASPIAVCNATDGDPASSVFVFLMNTALVLPPTRNVTLRTACAGLPVTMRMNYTGAASGNVSTGSPYTRPCTLVSVSDRSGVSLIGFSLDAGACTDGPLVSFMPRGRFLNNADVYETKLGDIWFDFWQVRLDLLRSPARGRRRR